MTIRVLGVEDLDPVVALVHGEQIPASVVEIDSAGVAHRAQLPCLVSLLTHPGLRRLAFGTDTIKLGWRLDHELEGAVPDVLAQHARRSDADLQAEGSFLARYKRHLVLPILVVLDLHLVKSFGRRHRNLDLVPPFDATGAVAITGVHPEVRRVAHLQRAERRTPRVASRSVGRRLCNRTKVWNLLQKVLLTDLEADSGICAQDEQVRVFQVFLLRVLHGGRKAFTGLYGTELLLQDLHFLLGHTVDL
mmetsp:Transcript_11448/g.29585  ORF Transcript_11448/g.29585 Transcript_11448/m.29585 type:complete len:248 (+) Transcript_11448:920-1663(+)